MVMDEPEISQDELNTRSRRFENEQRGGSSNEVSPVEGQPRLGHPSVGDIDL